jgi:hypothetical protein
MLENLILGISMLSVIVIVSVFALGRALGEWRGR